MSSPRRLAGRRALSLAASLSLLASLAHAEPPLMKEQSVEPKIQAISPDGRFAISLGGFLQARYTGVTFEKEADVSQFGTPRTRLYSFGHVHSKDFRYRLMVGTPPYSQQLQLFDAYLEVRLAHELRLRAGRFKLPIFREWVESARLLSSVERSALTTLLIPGRDYGLMASGAFIHESVEYALGFFNGAGDIATMDSDTTPAFAGRVVWNTTGRSIEGEVDFDHSPLALAIGASGYSTWKPSAPAVAPARDLPHLREHMTGVEATLRWNGLDVAVELMARRREQSGRAEDTGGGFVRVTRFLPSANVSVGGRATHFTSSRRDGPRRSELEAEFGYYLDEHDLKFSLDVGSARTGRHAATEHFVQAQAQVAF